MPNLKEADFSNRKDVRFLVMIISKGHRPKMFTTGEGMLLNN